MNSRGESQHNSFQYVLKNKLEDLQKQVVLEDAEVLNPEEQAVSMDIIKEYKTKIEDLEKFMNREYMLFDFKINRCLMNYCYQDIYKPRVEILECTKQCTQGLKHADKFVSERIEEFTKGFSICIEEAQSYKKDIMKESFQCYEKLLNTFDKVKQDIGQEFSNYE